MSEGDDFVKGTIFKRTKRDRLEKRVTDPEKKLDGTILHKEIEKAFGHRVRIVSEKK